jgi:uncharacterized GH25 family protein
MTASRHISIAAVLALALAAVPALAHEYWLAPTRYDAARGDTLAIRALVGTGFRGEPRPYAASRVRRFTLETARSLDLSKLGTNGDLVYARLIAPDDGGALIAYASDFASIELPAAEFDAYLALEGLEGPRAARAKLGAAAGPGRERYARCCKTWIAGREPRRAARACGLPLELVPLGDPAAAGPITVRVLFHGRPLAGALVRAWNQPLAGSGRPAEAAERDSVGPARAIRTGRDGLARLDLAHGGEWLLSCVHMVPCADRSAADWESLWASLTFARAEPRR